MLSVRDSLFKHAKSKREEKELNWSFGQSLSATDELSASGAQVRLWQTNFSAQSSSWSFMQHSTVWGFRPRGLSPSVRQEQKQVHSRGKLVAVRECIFLRCLKRGGGGGVRPGADAKSDFRLWGEGGGLSPRFEIPQNDANGPLGGVANS